GDDAGEDEDGGAEEAAVPGRVPHHRRVMLTSAPAASEDEPYAHGDEDERPEEVGAKPVQPPQVAEQEVEPRHDQDRRPEELVPPELSPHGRQSSSRG